MRCSVAGRVRDAKNVWSRQSKLVVEIRATTQGRPPRSAPRHVKSATLPSHAVIRATANVIFHSKIRCVEHSPQECDMPLFRNVRAHSEREHLPPLRTEPEEVQRIRLDDTYPCIYHFLFLFEVFETYVPQSSGCNWSRHFAFSTFWHFQVPAGRHHCF